MCFKASNPTSTSGAIFWAGLCGVALWLSFLACLPSLWGSSEAREAHVVALMHSTSEYILPLRNGLIPSKPPLFHWLASALMSILPIAPIVAARWVSVFAAVLIVLQARLLGSRLATLVAPHDSEYRRTVQVLAPALLLTSYGFVTMATDARVDMCFAALALLALTALIGPVTAEEWRSGVSAAEENRRFSWFFALCGLATVAKGPLGLVLPTLAGFCWYLCTRGLRAALRAWIRPRIGWVLFIVLALPWYLMAALKGGEGFVGRQLLFENLQRLAGGEFVNAQPWYFYFQVTVLATFPWSLIFLGGSLRWLASMGQRWQQPGSIVRRVAAWQVHAFLCSWYWLGFLLFSVASGKRPSYLLPLLPAVALQAALAIANWWRLLEGRSIERLRRLCIGMVALLLALSIALVALLDSVKMPGAATLAGLGAFPARLIWALEIAQVLCAMVLVVLVLRWQRGGLRDRSVSTLFALWFLVMSTITSVSWLAKGEFKGFALMAEQITTLVGPSDSLRVVRTPRDEYFDPLLYYLNRAVVLQSPEARSIACPGFTLARADWVEGVTSEPTAQGVRIVVEMEEWRNKNSVRPELSPNRLALVECQKSPTGK